MYEHHRQYLMKQQDLYSEYIYGKLSSKTIHFRIHALHDLIRMYS